MPFEAPGGILALDLALSTGWCFGDVGEIEPEAGTWSLGEETGATELGEACLRLDNELHDAIQLYRPSVVIIEAALRRVSHRLLLGLAAHAYSCCARSRVPCEEKEVNHVRLRVLGRYRYPKGTVKLHVRRWCEARGWDPGTHDEADARVLWQYKCDQVLLARDRRAA